MVYLYYKLERCCKFVMTDCDLQFIEGVTYGLGIYTLQRKEKGYDKALFMDMLCHIMEVLSKWTGQTWVGCKKDKKTENVFQKFFEALYSLIGYIQYFEKIMSTDEIEFAALVTYSGAIYRYLGSSDSANKVCVEIEYNNIYVSWSKNEKNSYIESKLYGPCLLVQAETSPFDYAIDLEGIDIFYRKITGKNVGVVKGKEREVVYPTKESCILSIVRK